MIKFTSFLNIRGKMRKIYLAEVKFARNIKLSNKIKVIL